MIKYIIIALSLISIFLFSCKKEELAPLKIVDTDTIDTAYVGIFEWSFSAKTLGEYTVVQTSSESADNFGIEIKDDARVITYKNGVELETYYIVSIQEKNSITIDCKNESQTQTLSLIYSNKMLVNNQLPVKDASNRYYKN